ALELMEDPNCSKAGAIVDAANFFDYEIFHKLNEAKQCLHLLNPSLSRFNQVIHRISSLVMSLKISSGISEDEEGEFFLPIAQALESIGEESLNTLTQIKKTIEELKRQLHPSFDQATRGSYA